MKKKKEKIIVDKNKFIEIAILLMPNHYKRVMMLRYFEEMSYKEISEKLDISIENARMNLCRGKKMLHNIWEEFEKLSISLEEYEILVLNVLEKRKEKNIKKSRNKVDILKILN